MQVPHEISSEKLTLKSVKSSDLDSFYNAFSESFANLNQYYSPAWAKFKTLPTKDEMQTYIDRIISEFGNKESLVYSIFDKNHNFVGQGELHHIDMSVPKVRLGYWIRDKETNKNYATETANILTRLSFDILQCQRVEIRNDVRNKASGTIAKKLGYNFLTVFEKNKQGKEGDFWDLEIYARLDTSNLPHLNIEYINDQS